MSVEEVAISALARVLLRHRRVVVPELFAGTTGHGDGAEAGVALLEGDLLARGFLLSAPLRRRLAAMPAQALAAAGTGLLEAVDAELGGGVPHVPLFRGFPDSVPADTTELYVLRVFSLLLQEPEQPCVLCARVGTVHPVSPCAHLVCRACWDGSDYSGCPICHRRINPDDPFLRLSRPSVLKAGEKAATPSGPAALLTLGDADETARDLLTAMLTRQIPLPAGDLADLEVLVRHLGPDAVPDQIPVRENRAVVLACLLPAAPAEAMRALLARYTDTATDVLRTLSVLAGGDAGLRLVPPRHRSLPRPVRRAVLAHLDALPFPALAEDMARYLQRWKRMAEVLHPFEHHRRHPDAALAFALIRRTPVYERTSLGRALRQTAARHPDVVRVDGERLRRVTFGTRLEEALRAGDRASALRLAAERPGELARRLVHLLRFAGPDGAEEVCARLRRAAPRVSPAVLVSALTQLRIPAGGTRLFLPRGGQSLIWYEPDRRDPLPDAVRERAAEVIEGELLRRAGSLPPVGHAVLDEALADLAIPVAQRSASSALLRMSRGSVQPLPGGGRFRLFLHWMEPDGVRVDLDLSVAFYDEHGRYLGTCDYTNLRFADDAAVHSGDLTSAPPPQGASEFVDLRPKRLREAGVRRAVVAVFSYNDVPFEKLQRGFAGVMRHPGGRLFDPAAVTQRFDLTGPAKVLVPFAMDLEAGTLRWADLNLSALWQTHYAHAYRKGLAEMAQALDAVFDAPGRPTLWDAARWHAAARAEEVTVRRRDGAFLRYRRGDGEDARAFAARLGFPEGADARVDDAGAGSAGFAALVRGNLEPATGADVFALYPWRLDATRLRLLDAAGLIGALAPAQEVTPGTRSAARSR
ncbi:MXAN_6230/SCO0854 family RING domain-containing protein [Thermomonospora amylolytica]|uniref:MXAN_6230/SCO0854 family RING domain-containing protein n=1 Tax=Thermomonospora amylolytica TaxID=1411117 RepID=UPI002D79953C|nr:MXAN_6230/SCO0854 family RING domain-containing protein [Thermomonospora amylolytica]